MPKNNFIKAATSHSVPKQLALIGGTWAKSRFAFGGSLLKNSHPKSKRIFNPRLPLHLVLHSSKAHGRHSLLAFNSRIGRLLHKQSTQKHVQILSCANAGNHLHLLVRASSRGSLNSFLRAICGHIAMIASGTKKGRSQSSLSNPRSPQNTSFWDTRPFSRIVNLGNDLKNVSRYIVLNSMESAGFNRLNLRFMFQKIQKLIAAGELPRSTYLTATGFS